MRATQILRGGGGDKKPGQYVPSHPSYANQHHHHHPYNPDSTNLHS